MTKFDLTEIKELLSDGIAHINEVQELKMKLIDLKLDSIIEQTTKTNETVRRHTDQIGNIEKVLPHTEESCPQNARMRVMWEERISNKGVKKWQLAALTVGGAIVGSVVSIIAVFEFILKYKP